MPAFNAATAWLALSEDQQRRAGEAALWLHVASIKLADEDVMHSMRLSAPWAHAEQSAFMVLSDACRLDPDDFTAPDLEALGALLAQADPG